MNESLPWRNPWRGELAPLLQALPAARTPALRRSRQAEWLFVTDLPQCADAAACALFIRQAESLGWEALLDRGWISLRKATRSLPFPLFPGESGSEAACVRELLRRHPGSGAPDLPVFALMKAREEGASAFEAACGQLHQELARRLRTGEEYPAISPESPD